MNDYERQKIIDEGYNAGYNDIGIKCPYPEDSEEELYWYSAYNEGLNDYSKSFDIYE
jgi:hypothetical protein